MVTQIAVPDDYDRLDRVAFAVPAETLHTLRRDKMFLCQLLGSEVTRGLLAYGPECFFVGPYRCLRSVYVSPRPVFKRVNLKRFVGRTWLLNQVDAFLRDHDCGYFILEAEAGLGKTSFLAWLVRERHYIHHFTELAPGEVSVETGLKNLVAQLIRAWELDPYIATGVLPSSAKQPYFLQYLLFEAARRRDELRPGEKIVLVVDALDKAGTPEGQNVLGLPSTLPKGVFFIVSRRPVDTLLQTDEPHRTFPLEATGDQNLDDMRAYLKGAVKWKGVAYALKKSNYSPQHFIDTLLEKCQGVWIYMHYVVQEIERGKRSPLDLDTLPDGLTRYYIHYWMGWRAKDEEHWYETYLPLLSTLAVAKGSIHAKELVAWAAVDIPNWLLDQLLNARWRPFLEVTGSGQRTHYQFYHATLCELFEGQVEWGELERGERRFVGELKQATIDACRRIIQKAQEPEVRRDAAFRLTCMRWFDDISDVCPDEMLNYLEIIGRYASSPADRRYLVQNITSMVDSEAVRLSKRRQIQLLLYRAVNLGYLGELDEAAEDYREAKQLIGAKTNPPEYQKMSARANLGLGNIARFQAEKLTKPEDQERRRKSLQEAEGLYREAAKLAQAYKQDVILEAHIYKELSLTYALLKDWEKAEESYRSALEVLETGKDRVQDPRAYADRYAEVLERACHVRWEKGESLFSLKKRSQAFTEYEIGYKFAQKEIATLKSSGKSEGLVIAHLNSGDCLLGMSKCSDRDASQFLDRACEDWQTALGISRHLGLSDRGQEASELLDQHCQIR
jgi:tetratricopeptide (TPR) repeat protein